MVNSKSLWTRKQAKNKPSEEIVAVQVKRPDCFTNLVALQS